MQNLLLRLQVGVAFTTNLFQTATTNTMTDMVSPITASESSSAPTKTNNDAKPTGFFSLPRELRDDIYSMVRKDHTLTLNRKIFACRTLVPSVRLVSRQFKSEYDQSAQTNTSVHILDSSQELAQGERLHHIPRVPRFAANSSRLVVNWSVLYDCNKPFGGLQTGLSDGAFEIQRNLSKLVRLASSLPFVVEVCVCMFIHPRQHLKRIVEQLIACPVLTGLVVKSYSSLHPKLVKDRATFAVWSRERGFLLDNTHKKRAVR